MSADSNATMSIQIVQIASTFKQTLHVAALCMFGLLVLAAVCAPFLNASACQDVHTMLHGFCHQIAERCYVIDGQQMPICARCLGVAVGVCVAAVSALCGAETTRFWTLKFGISGCVWIVVSWLVGFGLPPEWHVERTIAGIAGGVGLYVSGCCSLDASAQFVSGHLRRFTHYSSV